MSGPTLRPREPKRCGHCGKRPTVASSLVNGTRIWHVICGNHPFQKEPKTEPHPTRDAAVAEWNEECV